MDEAQWWFEPRQVVRALDTGERFEILERYRGAFGEVYPAVRQRNGARYALKVVRRSRWQEEATSRAELTRGMRREALLWVMLGKHPNIVQAHWFEAACRVEDRTLYAPFIVMECVVARPGHGSSLKGWMDGRTPPGLRSALKVAVQVATGLLRAQQAVREESAFDEPFVHRDLKPSNIMVAPDGTAKVSDFGLAKAFSEAAGIVCGTRPYMPPEQSQGRPADERADLFALGCVLLEMLAGRLVGTGIPWEVAAQALPAAAPCGAPVPPALRALVRECVAPEAARRPASIRRFRERLQEIYRTLYGEPVAVDDAPGEMSAEEWNQRGVALEGLGRYERFLDCCRKAAALDDREARYHLDEGHAHYRLGEPDAARESYRRALDCDGRCARAMIGLGNVCQSQGHPREAIGWFDRAEAIDDELPGLYISRGRAHLDVGNCSAAERDFHRAAGLGRPSEAYLALGNIHFSCYEDEARALESYQRAIEADPLFVEAWESKARVLEFLDRDIEAEEHRRHAKMLRR
jgi:Tfp pilus assembly protein PilF